MDKEPIYVSSPLPIEPEPAPPVSLRKLLRTLKAYLPVIVLAVAAVMVGYLIIAVAAYIYAPTEHVTSMPFRVEFEGAEDGEYPNGSRFSSAEILSTPILTRTFQQNDLGRFTKFADFANSVFILESNMAQERLANEYRARLSDARLTSVDRDRIQREYELKLASLNKNELSINYRRKRRVDPVPEVVARKVLSDVLRNWADFVASEQHVLEYRVAVLSPDVVAGTRPETANPIITTLLLRDRVTRLTENIDAIGKLPNAELARTKSGLSLSDIRVSLDEIVRFRIDPFVDRAADSGVDDRPETMRFLAAQLAHDQRRLNARMVTAETAQRTFALYVNGQTERQRAAATSAASEREAAAEETKLTPQVSESFIDRLIQLSSAATDTDFRKKLAEEYQRASLAVAPLEESVAYDRTLLENMRTSSGSGGGGLTREAAAQEIAAIRTELRRLTSLVQEIHGDVSRNLNPGTQLYRSWPAQTTAQRTLTLVRLAQYGLLLLAVAIPAVILAVLVHHRMRREEAEETRAAHAAASEA